MRCAFFRPSGQVLEVAPERNPEVSRPNDVGAISTPDLVEVLRVLVGDSSFIRQAIHEDLRSPILHLNTKNRIGHGIVALTESWAREPIIQLIQ